MYSLYYLNNLHFLMFQTFTPDYITTFNLSFRTSSPFFMLSSPVRRRRIEVRPGEKEVQSHKSFNSSIQNQQSEI